MKDNSNSKHSYRMVNLQLIGGKKGIKNILSIQKKYRNKKWKKT